jgi:predicted nucleic acid-binding protein
VRLVIADTGPVNYLILIGRIEILPRLFERVIVPYVVLAELSHELAPAPVQRWIATAPDWLEVENSISFALLAGIHEGEAAIALSSRLRGVFHAIGTESRTLGSSASMSKTC